MQAGSMRVRMTKKREWLASLSRTAGDRHFDPATRRCLIARDTVWYALGLLLDPNAERRALGNGLLAKLQSEDATHTPATMIAIERGAPELLSPEAHQNLLANIRRSLEPALDVEWHDGNVNHPLAAYCTLICGGELCKEEWAVEAGVAKLKRFRQVIGNRRHRYRRQAEMSEYNSLTYTALNLWFLACIAEYAIRYDARSLALFLEERLWVDVAMHFHAPSGQFAGPHSRSYQDDSDGGFSALHCTMLAAFDDDLFLEPDLAAQYDHPSNLVENSLIAILPFHVPDAARELAWKKPLPYLVQKTTYGESYHENSFRWIPPEGAKDAREQRASYLIGKPATMASGLEARLDRAPFAFDDEVYPGGWSDLTTFMTGEYALGTAALPYVNAGHADAFIARWRRSETVTSLKDFRSLSVRGVYNDPVVGQRNYCHVAGKEIDASFLYEEGRTGIYQHRNKAIVCYTPKRSGHLGVTGFRIDLMLTEHARLDEFAVGGKKVDDLELRASADARIFFRDYKTYGAIIPLPVVPSAGEGAMRVWRANNHLIISLYSYLGDVRDFSREEIGKWRTGFAVEFATVEEFSSFDTFVSHASKSNVDEMVEEGGIRAVTYVSGHDVMKFRYDPLREAILSRTWNGVEEIIDHLHVEAGEGAPPAAFTPATLFGDEAFPQNRHEQ
jgi:hypothetical protein